jgi:hypothetical protein
MVGFCRMRIVAVMIVVRIMVMVVVVVVMMMVVVIVMMVMRMVMVGVDRCGADFVVEVGVEFAKKYQEFEVLDELEFVSDSRELVHRAVELDEQLVHAFSVELFEIVTVKLIVRGLDARIGLAT